MGSLRVRRKEGRKAKRWEKMRIWYLCESRSTILFAAICIGAVSVLALNFAVRLRSYSSFSDAAKTADATNAVERGAEELLEEIRWDTDLRRVAPTFRDALAEYEKFHTEELRKLRSSGGVGKSWDPEGRDGVKVLVWGCPKKYCSGIGDRFRGILTTLLMAVATKRVFLIEWPDNAPAPLKDALIPNKIQWDAKVDTTQSVTLPWFECVGRRKCEPGGRYMPHIDYLPAPPPGSPQDDRAYDYTKNNASVSLLTDDLTSIFGETRVLRIQSRLHFNLDTFLFNPHNPLKSVMEATAANGMKTNDLERALIRFLFRPSSTLRQQIKAFQVKHQTDYNDKASSRATQGLIHTQYAGFHIRAGVDFGEHIALRSRFRETIKNKTETAKRMLDCLRSLGYEKGNIFLASDDREFKEIFRRLTRASDWHIFYKDAPAMHAAWPEKYPKSSSRRNGSPFVNIFLDLFLLGHSRTVVENLEHSGFTELAVWFGRTEALASNALQKCEAYPIRQPIKLRSLREIRATGF